VIGQLAVRFVVGGVIVSLFAVVGELFRPKTFAGIFGAAPSVALVTLGLTALEEGEDRAAAEAFAMHFGAVAMLVYAALLALVVRRLRLPAWLEAGLGWSAWLGVAFALWALFVRA
jgi:uncharacterized membrane protein (GlpM family)